MAPTIALTLTEDEAKVAKWALSRVDGYVENRIEIGTCFRCGGESIGYEAESTGNGPCGCDEPDLDFRSLGTVDGLTLKIDGGFEYGRSVLLDTSGILDDDFRNEDADDFEACEGYAKPRQEVADALRLRLIEVLGGVY